jgi:hypothetical protein
MTNKTRKADVLEILTSLISHMQNLADVVEAEHRGHRPLFHRRGDSMTDLTPEQQRQHDDDTAQVMQKLKAIGSTYGELITRKLITQNLPIEELRIAIDAVLADTRDFLVSNGTDENDTQISLAVINQAIIDEGRRIAWLLHEGEGTLQ